MPWVHEEKKFNCHIIMPHSVGGIIFRKGLVIIEHNSNNLSNVPNKMKQIIHAINIQKSCFFMACYTEILYVSNTTKKLHIVSDFNSCYMHSFYNYKQDIIYELLNSIH